MKIILLFLFLVVMINCSFDNKTGIWSGQIQENELKKESTIGKIINTKEKLFSEEKNVDNEDVILIEKAIKVDNWTSFYSNDKNLIPNIKFDFAEKLTFLSYKKIAGSIVHSPIIFEKMIIFSNDKGDIFIYDLNTNESITKINFYKKQHKKIKKKLYIKLLKNKLFVADNLGYLYSYNLSNKKFVWAKNYGIPYRSEIKITDGQLIVSNQDNTIFSYDVLNGNILWKFNLKNSFIKTKLDNSLVIDKDLKSLFVHTTEGEIYSINYLEKRINWVFNLKRTAISSDFDVFYNYPVVIQNNNIFTGSNNRFTSFDKVTGEKKWELNLKLSSLPIISNNFSFVHTQSNFLICIDNSTGQILWSKNVYKEFNKKTNKFKNLKTKNIVRFILLNNKLSLIYSSGKIANFNYKNGEFISFDDTKKKISNPPIFGDNKLIFFSNKKMMSLM